MLNAITSSIFGTNANQELYKVLKERTNNSSRASYVASCKDINLLHIGVLVLIVKSDLSKFYIERLTENEKVVEMINSCDHEKLECLFDFLFDEDPIYMISDNNERRIISLMQKRIISLIQGIKFISNEKLKLLFSYTNLFCYEDLTYYLTTLEDVKSIESMQYEKLELLLKAIGISDLSSCLKPKITHGINSIDNKKLELLLRALSDEDGSIIYYNNFFDYIQNQKVIEQMNSISCKGLEFILDECDPRHHKMTGNLLCNILENANKDMMLVYNLFDCEFFNCKKAKDLCKQVLNLYEKEDLNVKKVNTNFELVSILYDTNKLNNKIKVNDLLNDKEIFRLVRESGIVPAEHFTKNNVSTNEELLGVILELNVSNKLDKPNVTHRGSQRAANRF